MLPLLTDLPMIVPGSHPAPGPLDVHIWRHDHGTSIGPERFSALLALLSSDEHTRFAHLRPTGNWFNGAVGWWGVDPSGTGSGRC